MHNVVCQLPGIKRLEAGLVTCACAAKKISVFSSRVASLKVPRLAAAAPLSSRTFTVSGIYSSDFGGRDAAYLMTHVLLFLLHFLIVLCCPLVAPTFQEAAPLISRSISFRPSRFSTFFSADSLLLLELRRLPSLWTKGRGTKSVPVRLLPASPGEGVMCHPGGGASVMLRGPSCRFCFVYLMRCPLVLTTWRLFFLVSTQKQTRGCNWYKNQSGGNNQQNS